MTRRALLASLAAAFVSDPERLLWKPGAKLISVPAPRVLTVAELIDQAISELPHFTYGGEDAALRKLNSMLDDWSRYRLVKAA